MLEIIKAEAGGTDTSSSLKLISKLLVRSPEDVFLAWMITCFVPWAREPQKHLEKPSSKKTPSPASIAAREGIKADNKITKVVDEAVSYLSDIIAMKDSVITDSQSTSSPLKRRLSPSARVFQGLAVRRWGSHWRISAMYAILAEVGESQTEAGKQGKLYSL